MANFKYVETITASETVINKLKEEVTGFISYPYEPTAGESEELNAWTVHSEVADVDGRIQELVLRGTASDRKSVV